MTDKMSRAVENPKPTVLVVDDDILIRMVIAEYLRDCGYRVLEAANGYEAVTALKSKAQIDLVFADIHAGGNPDGFSLAQLARKERPGVHVILTSSVSKAALKADDLCEDGPVVQKPYDHREVARRIRLLLATRKRKQ